MLGIGEDTDLDSNLSSEHLMSKLNFNCKYYGEEEVNNVIVENTGVSIIHFNTRSLQKNFNKIVYCINNFGVKFDIIAITETWLEDGNTDTFDLEGYKVIHVVRNSKRGSGCSLYVNELFNFNIVKPFYMSQTNMFGCVTVDLEIINHRNIKVVCVYRAPGNSISDFSKKWEEILQQMSLGNKDIYICGDFNINLLNCDSHSETEQFVYIMYSAGLFPAITKPTRITRTSATLIDNIFTNNVTENLNCGIVINETSDHLPVFVSSNPVTKNGNTVQINKK